MARLRLAYFSPFNPQKSGVSDYSEELLPYLARKADVDIVAGPYTLNNAAITRHFRVLTGEEFLRESASYDMPVYQVANSYYQHAYMVPYMEKCPGLVVLHDYYLHYLIFGMTLLKGDFPALRQVLRSAYGTKASGLAWRLLLSAADPYRISLTGPLIDLGRAIVTHSQCAKELVLKDRPLKDVRVVPMAMPEIPAGNRSALREKHGIREGEFVLASVSTLSYTKRIDVVLDAVRLLRQKHPQLKLWILGGGRVGERTRAAIDSPEMQGCVRLTGWTSSETYEELLVAADAVVDLRYPSGAETSASLLRAIAAGKPAFVSDQGTFRELPDSFATKIAVGEGEENRLARAVSELIDFPSLQEARGEAAWAHARDHMRLEQAADGYLDAIGAVMEQGRTQALSASLLTSNPGRAERLLWGSLYRVFRVGHLVRTYGWQVALQRIRGEVKVGGAA